MTQAFEINQSPVVPTTTAIEFLLDETGSMHSVWDQTISGFNEYVGGQKSQPGECLLTLTKFDTRGVRTQYTDAAIANVALLDRQSYIPTASTNLYDAIGQRIHALTARQETLPADTAILFVIMTDGEDNASREYNAEIIKNLITEKQAAGWTFVFLGANQDAWKVGQTFGMAKGNTMTYDNANIKGAMGDLCAATTAYRSVRSSGIVANASSSTDFFNNTAPGK